MVFVDTGAWFAFFMPSDPSHSAVRAWFAANQEPLVTTDYCVDETLTLLLYRGEQRRAIEAGKAFFEENLTQLHFVTDDEIHRAWILFQRRAAARWSFTDCTSQIVITSHQIRIAIALDDHFRQFGDLTVVPGKS